MSRVSRAIAATRTIPVAQSAVFGFLADLERHRLLDDCFVEVLALEESAEDGRAIGGTVRMRGPLALERTARTRLLERRPDSLLAGSAHVGPRTSARVTWTLASVAAGTTVRLETVVEQVGPLDALLLAIGGRRWLRRRFGAILQTLERRLAAAQSASA